VRSLRAVLFDLDDTLYPIAEFRRSGFRAVAAEVEAAWGLPRADALGVLNAAMTATPGRELQALAAHAGRPAHVVPSLVEVVRRHVPELRLPDLTRSVLRRMRTSWRIAVVTNGRPDIQARKVRALGLEGLVDVVIYAAEHGSGAGKPDAAPFLAACRAVGVPRTVAVFVGDDPVCDIDGAHAAGLRTIWLRMSPGATPPASAAVVAPSLAEVPTLAARLDTPWRAHVA
jgi:putative hydrolase of the HAD superfamily